MIPLYQCDPISNHSRRSVCSQFDRHCQHRRRQCDDRRRRRRRRRHRCRRLTTDIPGKCTIFGESVTRLFDQNALRHAVIIKSHTHVGFNEPVGVHMQAGIKSVVCVVCVCVCLCANRPCMNEHPHARHHATPPIQPCVRICFESINLLPPGRHRVSVSGFWLFFFCVRERTHTQFEWVTHMCVCSVRM